MSIRGKQSLCVDANVEKVCLYSAIGEESGERLEVVPMQMRVIEHIRKGRIRSINPAYPKVGQRFTVASPASSSTVARLRRLQSKLLAEAVHYLDRIWTIVTA